MLTKFEYTTIVLVPKEQLYNNRVYFNEVTCYMLALDCTYTVLIQKCQENLYILHQ